VKSWWRAQAAKIRRFAEIVIALVLDAGLILAVWGIWKVVTKIIGVDPNTIQDREVYWAVRLSEFSTIVVLAVYIIGDLVREVIKIYREIKRKL